MSLETIRDPHNRVMGFVVMDADGNGVARDAHMKPLGRYNAERDFTYDAHDRPFGRSNQLSALIRRAAD